MTASAVVSKPEFLSTDPLMKHHRPYQLSTPAPTLALRAPAGIHPAAILARQAAMIEAGTHPILAERLASSASENQALRDRDPRFAARAAEPAAA